MSGLAGLLTGRVLPGIRTWRDAAPVDEVRRAVEDAGWRFVLVDEAATKQEFLDRVGRALDLPDHYGRNFDALADMLADLPDDVEGTVLLWEGWGDLALADGRAFDVALTVLGTRVEAERGAGFSVLLAGEGPDVPGVDDLDGG